MQNPQPERVRGQGYPWPWCQALLTSNAKIFAFGMKIVIAFLIVMLYALNMENENTFFEGLNDYTKKVLEKHGQQGYAAATGSLKAMLDFVTKDNEELQKKVLTILEGSLKY